MSVQGRSSFEKIVVRQRLHLLQKGKEKMIIIAFLAGTFFGAVAVICWALCIAAKERDD